MLKDYLNAAEMNSFMFVTYLLETISMMREDWTKRCNITKEEHRALKTAETNLLKFHDNVLARLSNSELVKITKKRSKFKVRILDNFTMDMLERDFKKKLVNAVVPRDQFQDWTEQMMEVTCKNCTKHHDSCRLHEIFQDNFIPESTWGLENCRFAYKEVDSAIRPEKIKEYQTFKKKKLGA
jgi:hypothetical protein